MGCEQIAESDITKQAQQTAALAAKNIQSGTKVAAERFNNFVEDSGGPGSAKAVEPERKDFWDSFGDVGGGEEKKKAGGSIGTAAMRKGGSGGGGGKEDKWDNW